MVLKFTIEEGRVTKNTVRFQEEPPEGEAAVIGPLYMQKYAYERLGKPSTIEVTIGVV